MSIDAFVRITLIIALFISCIIVMVLKNIITKFKAPKSKYMELFIILIAYFTIFNFMYLENFYYVDAITMVSSILMFILASKVLVDSGKLHVLKTIILLIIGILCYQGTFGIFIAMTTLFSILKNRGKWKIIFFQIVEAGSLLVLALVSNVLIMKLIGTSREIAIDIQGILSNVSYILTDMWGIIYHTCGMFPRGFLILITSILLIAGIVYFIKHKEEENCVEIILLITFVILSDFIISVITLMSFDAARMHFAIGALIRNSCNIFVLRS